MLTTSTCSTRSTCDSKWKKKKVGAHKWGSDPPFQERRTYALRSVKQTDGAHRSSSGNVTHVLTHNVPRRLQSSRVQLWVTPRRTKPCVPFSTHPARSRVARAPALPHTRTVPRGSRGRLSPLAVTRASPTVSLYLPRRQDAGRRWLHSCHRSPPLSPSGSADWGPLCFQQVPWSRRSYSFSLATKPPRPTALTAVVPVPMGSMLKKSGRGSSGEGGEASGKASVICNQLCFYFRRLCPFRWHRLLLFPAAYQEQGEGRGSWIVLPSDASWKQEVKRLGPPRQCLATG